jgi:hypothetical protein
MFQLNGKPLALDVAFTADIDVPTIVPAVYEPVNGTDELQIVEPEKMVMVKDTVQFPANWLRNATAEERNALGIKEVVEPVLADDRFYWGGDGKSPKLLAVLQSDWVTSIKATANTLLASTDWMVIRKAERGVAIPEDTVTYRASVLAECSRAVAAVQAAKTVPDLVDAVTALNWPT